MLARESVNIVFCACGAPSVGRGEGCVGCTWQSVCLPVRPSIAPLYLLGARKSESLPEDRQSCRYSATAVRLDARYQARDPEVHASLKIPQEQCRTRNLTANVKLQDCAY